MNASLLITQFLVVALGLVMFGLGLSLSTQDFTRLLKHPKAVAIALVLQVIVLPLACYGLIVMLQVPPIYAVGLMLLAASPGGISANLFSHLFGGNVAMNISLTAVNTVLSIVTLPLVSNWAISTFANTGQVVPMQFGKLVEVIAIVLVPVALGMWIRTRKPALADRSEKPMKIFSGVVLAVVSLGAMAKEWSTLTSTFAEVGVAVVAFNLLSLLMGYFLSRSAGLDEAMATAISFEIGIHNSTMAIFIALAVLNNSQLALPAAIYSVSMYITATLFGLTVLRRTQRTDLIAT
jgi:BASS family bile acid:Na+ symporter